MGLLVSLMNDWPKRRSPGVIKGMRFAWVVVLGCSSTPDPSLPRHVRAVIVDTCERCPMKQAHDERLSACESINLPDEDALQIEGRPSRAAVCYFGSAR